jgi:hypothetical protein
VPTFLTTPRMSAALRARVERAVSPRARARHQARATGLGGLFTRRERVGAGLRLPLAALVLVALLVGVMQHLEKREIEEQRAAVLTALSLRGRDLPEGHEAFLATIAQRAAEVAGDPYGGDVVAPELTLPGELDAWLARPAVYLRGATPELRDPQKLAEVAATSIKDAFLLCLVEPPRTRAERDVLAKVRGVYFGGAAVDGETANVRRLVEAQVGLTVLGPAFEAEARAADALAPLKKLAKDLEAAPIEAARDAANAELLIVVADEIDAPDAAIKPAPGSEPLAYIAQEHPHDARVALVDLTSGKVLLRVRRRVDASARGGRATALDRIAIQGCDLALSARGAAED